jgi:hypothetical protein
MRALFDVQLDYRLFEGTFVGRFEVADVAQRPLGPPMRFGREELNTRMVLLDVVDAKSFRVPKR